MTATPQELVSAGMSTVPVEAGPGVPRQRLAPVRRAWRQLTSMRTALLLLFLLALASVPGGFLPQRALNPVKLQEYQGAHRTLAPLLDRLYLFDVFSSPWFAAIYLLLFVSLVGCLGPRIRLHARALRAQPPRVPARLDRLPVSARWETEVGTASAAAGLASALRRGRWRVVRREDGAISAEKGYLRETGNLLFHVSLVLLLVGIALGGLFGFKGTVLVKEREGFANAVLNYDDITPGRSFDPASLVPFHLTLQDFRATYGEDGKARTFDAELLWAPGPDAAPRRYDLRVNAPLHVGAAKVYLIGHGYAPKVVVRDPSGAVVLDQSVPCLPQDGNFLSNCTIKVPDAGPKQIAFQGVFTPTTVQDPRTGQVGSVHPAAQDPVLTLVSWRGDLQLDSGIPRSVYSLDTSRLEAIRQPPQALRPGQTWRMPDGASVTFTGVQEWTTLQVTQDPGKLVALAAGAGMVVGLLLSLFVRRRRLWVRLTPAPGAAGEGGAPRRTVVEVGGLARTDPEAYAAEFEELTARLRAVAPTATRE